MVGALLSSGRRYGQYHRDAVDERGDDGGDGGSWLGKTRV